MRRLLGTPRQWAVSLPGMALLLCGVTLIIAAGVEVPFGAGSWQALETGIVATFDVPFSTVVVVESLLVLVLSWRLLHVRPGPGTLLLAVLGGPVIEALLATVPTPGTWAAAAATFVGGAALTAVGLGLYIGADVGASAQDMLFVGLYRRLPVSPGVARLALDLVLGLAGLALGGQVGVGTLLVLVVVPPIVERSLPLGERLAGTAAAVDGDAPRERASIGDRTGQPVPPPA